MILSNDISIFQNVLLKKRSYIHISCEVCFEFFLHRSLWSAISNFTHFISHFSFHKKSARSLAIHRQICSVSEAKLTDEPVMSLFFGVTSEIIVSHQLGSLILPAPPQGRALLKVSFTSKSRYPVLKFLLGYFERSSQCHVCCCLRVQFQGMFP